MLIIPPTVAGKPGRTRFELECPDQNRIAFIYLFFFETQSKLKRGDSQHASVSRNQRASFACVSTAGALYTARTNAADKKGRKMQIPR